MNRLILAFLFFNLLTAACFGQESNYREKKLVFSTDTLVLDSLSLIPGSLILKDNSGNFIPDSIFKVDYPSAKLVFLEYPGSDTLLAAYRTFPLLFVKPYFHKDPRLIELQALGKDDPFIFRPGSQPPELFSFGSLEKNGSLSRGIRVGNNQDLSVNSAFNLQLSGKLSEDVEVQAAISDDNIPVQPEGNTQQIQDFDKVFIRVKSKQHSLTAGDFELGKPPGYFMNFYKKAKGGYFTTELKPGGNSLKAGLAGAVSKGKYTRNTIAGVEGNQGPYRLRGANNEQFIIILSGTERVFLDGQLMLRGEENDYVIDYNTAELTFTVKRLITLNSRIVVEFEYSDKNYSRSMLFASAQYDFGKWNTSVHAFSEQDSPNQPLLQDLNDPQKQFLSAVGDSLSDAFYPNADSVGFSPDEIRYKKIDTLGHLGVYVHSLNPEEALYRVGFSFTGQGKGDYRQKTSSANGRVFEWLAPVNGVPQGDHNPVMLLIPPQQMQMVTAAASYAFSQTTSFTLETAVSHKDLNLYAVSGNEDNTGGAVRTTLSDARPAFNSGKLSLRSSASYEFTDKKFRAIERFRPVEFERDFNLLPSVPKYEQLVSVRSGIYRNELPFFDYQLSSFQRAGVYQGFRHAVNSDIRNETARFFYTGSLLNSSDVLFNANYLKQHTGISREFFFLFGAGIGFEQEKNRFYFKNADSLAPASFSFLQYKAFVKNAEAHENKFLIEYALRDDYRPDRLAFTRKTNGKTLNAGLELLKNPSSVLRTGITYRVLNMEDSIKTPEKTLLGRIEYDFTAWKSLLNSITYYELGTGQEPKREFTYLEVPAGQGVYYWSAEETDYNKNGIKELNEFEIPKFSYLANHIRVFLPTNEFVRTKSTAFSQAINLNPGVRWRDKNGILKLISHFSDQGAYRLERKALDEAGNHRYLNPFYLAISDSALVSMSSSLRNTIFFNRTNPVFSSDFSFQHNGSRIFLLNGFDTRKLDERELRLRWVPARMLGTQGSVKKGVKRYFSPYAGKNYRVEFLETRPELTIQLNPSLRFAFFHRYTVQENTPEHGGEKAQSHTAGSEMRYNRLAKESVSAGISYIRNKFDGQANTAVAYEMLEGLQEGNNFTWNIFLQRSLANGLQLNLSYEGKSSPGIKGIHTGSVQARVVF